MYIVKTQCYFFLWHIKSNISHDWLNNVECTSYIVPTFKLSTSKVCHTQWNSWAKVQFHEMDFVFLLDGVCVVSRMMWPKCIQFQLPVQYDIHLNIHVHIYIDMWFVSIMQMVWVHQDWIRWRKNNIAKDAVKGFRFPSTTTTMLYSVVELIFIFQSQTQNWNAPRILTGIPSCWIDCEENVRWTMEKQIRELLFVYSVYTSSRETRVFTAAPLKKADTTVDWRLCD